jgi:hypothetical protein
MRRFFLLFGAALVTTAAARGQLRKDWCNVYSGTLGESTGIGMTLYASGTAIEGAYFYRKYLQDIPLQGAATSARDITLQEQDAAGTTKGTFHLHLAEHDPRFRSTEILQGEVLQGTWSGTDGAKTFPVALTVDHGCSKLGRREYEVAGANDDAPVEKNVQAFYSAVVAGKREEVAKYVSYPCTFFRDGKRSEINNPTEFLKNYDAIFTNEFEAKIANGVPHHMFANSQGIMIADGAVWFDAEGKARSFNNSPQL